MARQVVSRGSYTINEVNIRVEWPASLEVVELINVKNNMTDIYLKDRLEGRDYGYLEVKELRRVKNRVYAVMNSEEGWLNMVAKLLMSELISRELILSVFC